MYALVNVFSENYNSLAQLTWYQNKVLYAKKHGYMSISKTSDFFYTKDNSFGFEKTRVARDILVENSHIKWLWCTGTDSMVTNFNVKIEDRIDDNYDFLISTDVNGINSDSFLVKNSENGIEFLNHVLSNYDEYLNFWDTDQRAISTLLGFPPTGSDDWKNIKIEDMNKKYWGVVDVVPQRYFNSYDYKLYPEYKDTRDKTGNDGNWQPGDWLVHWPGTGLEKRIELAKYYNTRIIL